MPTSSKAKQKSKCSNEHLQKEFIKNIWPKYKFLLKNTEFLGILYLFLFLGCLMLISLSISLINFGNGLCLFISSAFLFILFSKILCIREDFYRPIVLLSKDDINYYHFRTTALDIDEYFRPSKRPFNSVFELSQKNIQVFSKSKKFIKLRAFIMTLFIMINCKLLANVIYPGSNFAYRIFNNVTLFLKITLSYILVSYVSFFVLSEWLLFEQGKSISRSLLLISLVSFIACNVFVLVGIILFYKRFVLKSLKYNGFLSLYLKAWVVMFSIFVVFSSAYYLNYFELISHGLRYDICYGYISFIVVAVFTRFSYLIFREFIFKSINTFSNTPPTKILKG